MIVEISGLMLGMFHGSQFRQIRYLWT